MRSLILVPVCLLLGCCTGMSSEAAGDQRPPPSAPAEEGPLKVTRFNEAIAQSFRYNTDLKQPMNVVVHNEREWRDLWSRIWKRQRAIPPLPTVDFSREMLVVAAMGERPTGAYAIRIDDVVDKGEELVTTVTRVSPGSRCGAGAVLTSPMDIVRVSSRSKPTRWIVRDEITSCS